MDNMVYGLIMYVCMSQIFHLNWKGSQTAPDPLQYGQAAYLPVKGTDPACGYTTKSGIW